MQKRTLILCTVGTRGDFRPFEAIARDLVAHGHRVVLLSNENWRAAGLATGAEFIAIADEDPPQSDRDDRQFFIRNIMPSFRRSYDVVEAELKRGTNPLLVSRSNMLGMDCAAEKYGLEMIRLCLQPCAIKSFDRPPWPWSDLASGRLRWLYRLAIRPAVHLMETVGRYRKLTNGFRRSVGLQPRYSDAWHDSRDLNIVLCPGWFSMPGADWPTRYVCVGFPDLPAGDVDPEMTAFVDRYRPAIFTPGTGVTDVMAFFDKAAEACRQLALPAVFLSPFLKPLPDRPDILVRDFVDLGAILPRARMLIHHGGIGTTGQALRAGIPQVIVPDRFDQPDNAMRVVQLGLGGAIMDRRAGASSWAGLMGEVLASKPIHARLAQAANAMRREDAIQSVVQLIEDQILPIPNQTAASHELYQ